MDCPACGTANSRVLDTFKGVEDKRKRECACGARWSSTEIIDKGSLRVATSADQSPPVSTNGNRSRRVTPHRGLSQPLAASGGGGVGGDLPSGSVSSLPPLSDPDPDPSNPTDQEVDRSIVGAWDGERWKLKFGAAWSTHFCAGARHYGHASDGKGIATLNELLGVLPRAERIAAQDRSAAMFAEFFADSDPKLEAARYPFQWFVQRWGGLRVPAVRGVGRAHDVRIGTGRAEDVKHTVTGEQAI